MSEKDRHSQDEKYERFRGMSLEEIQAHLAGLTETFEGIKKHYEGSMGSRRTVIKTEDLDQLLEAFSDLLPMSLNPGVQQEVLEEGEDLTKLTSGRISGLMQDTMMFAARFPNSGITTIPATPEAIARSN